MTIEQAVAPTVITEWFTASFVLIMFSSELLERVELG